MPMHLKTDYHQVQTYSHKKLFSKLDGQYRTTSKYKKAKGIHQHIRFVSAAKVVLNTIEPLIYLSAPRRNATKDINDW